MTLKKVCILKAPFASTDYFLKWVFLQCTVNSLRPSDLLTGISYFRWNVSISHCPPRRKKDARLLHKEYTMDEIYQRISHEGGGAHLRCPAFARRPTEENNTLINKVHLNLLMTPSRVYSLYCERINKGHRFSPKFSRRLN